MYFAFSNLWEVAFLVPECSPCSRPLTPSQGISTTRGGYTMDRLNWIARITYYLGWIVAACAGLAHMANLGTALERDINVKPANLLEVSFLLFVICMASELRAHVLARNR